MQTKDIQDETLNEHISGGQKKIFDSYFKLTERKTTIKTEILAAFTTFVTMAYIIVVNSQILADAGMPKAPVIGVTIIATAFACILMGLYANFPMALAPGMGLNAYFTYTVVQKLGVSWETALGAVFLSGVIFLVVVLTKAADFIVESIPHSLKNAITVGIGLFIALIGFKNSGIVVSDPNTLLKLGDLSIASTQMAMFGLVMTAFLFHKKIKGSFLIGMVVTALIGMFFKVGNSTLPHLISDVFSFPPAISPIFMKMDIAGAFNLGLLNVIFSFACINIFNDIGTLMGITKKAGLTDKNGNLPGLGKGLFCDAVSTMTGAAFGTSTVTSYIESASGVQEGGRTGLTSIFVGLLFLSALFFTPFIASIPSFATAPVLILIGVLMISDIIHINFDDFSELFPAFLTLIMIPLTFSIAQGIAFGFITYTLMKILIGRAKEIKPIMYFISIIFIIQFIYIP